MLGSQVYRGLGGQLIQFRGGHALVNTRAHLLNSSMHRTDERGNPRGDQETRTRHKKNFMLIWGIAARQPDKMPRKLGEKKRTKPFVRPRRDRRNPRAIHSKAF